MYISRTRATAGAVAMLATGAGAWTGGAVASASTLTCVKQPSIIQAAPAVGSSATVTGSVGSYTVGRPTTTTLTASSPVANTGWTGTVTISSGTRVRVVFHSTTTSALDRFTTSLSSTGAKLITHVVTCS
jgi:hypothetical protein